MKRIQQMQNELTQQQETWLITGVAGFIGSNILEYLLKNNQRVVGLDNYSTGFQYNLEEVKKIVSSRQWDNFKFIEGDIRNISDCQKACKGVDYVLHNAALGSVPRSIADPITTNSVNNTGFLNMLIAARDASEPSKVKRFVYAASSSTYGNNQGMPKVEDRIGKPLSPYAVTKYVNELYAGVFSENFEQAPIGLRYFNVFGPRQHPTGEYAAVIPKWIYQMIKNEKIYINGDGTTSRDFCFINNVVHANILAAKKKSNEEITQVYNIAVGESTTLNKLYQILRMELSELGVNTKSTLAYREFRPGDMLNSMADISKAYKYLKYVPSHSLVEGIKNTLPWYLHKINK